MSFLRLHRTGSRAAELKMLCKMLSSTFIDEIGYLSYGLNAANVLFHVVNHRHLKKRPMIFTTNKPLSEWGKVLHDEDLAAAILDRVLERGRFIQLDGPSGRTRHLNLEEVWPAPAERARISGTHNSRVNSVQRGFPSMAFPPR